MTTNSLIVSFSSDTGEAATKNEALAVVHHEPRIRRRITAFAVAIMILPFLTGIAAAIPIEVPIGVAAGLDEIYQNGDPVLDVIGWEDIAQRPQCKGNGGAAGAPTYYLCKSRAQIFIDSLSGDDEEFETSFDAWNATNAAAAKWTLKQDGGALPGGKLTVSLFEAFAYSKVGGLEIRMFWDYAGADKAQFYWSQGLYSNYTAGPGGGLGPPRYELDGVPQGTYPLPLYPFQYADRHFYDMPEAHWPDAFFDAEVFLSKVDRAARTLTVYEGVAYGFQLSAQPNRPPPIPEPSTISLFLVALIGLAVAKCRRASVGSASEDVRNSAMS